jgi:hypothetical protein
MQMDLIELLLQDKRFKTIGDTRYAGRRNFDTTLC